MPFSLSKRPNVKIGITTADLCYIARKIDVGVAEIRTVDEVESAGSGFLSTSQRPKILFEGHYFYRILARENKALAQRAAQLQPTICYPSWSSHHYLGREAEYGRIAKATELCHQFGVSDGIALRSASWGRFQIMGDNFRKAGFSSVEAFVEAMFVDEMKHLESFGDYLVATFLDDELRDHRWTALASGYNGPGYKRNNYHIKLPNAFARFSRMKVDCSSLLHVVQTMPGERVANPADQGFANTSLDNRYVAPVAGGLVIADDEIDLFADMAAPSSTEAGSADSQNGLPQEPAYTVEEPDPGAAGSPAATGEGEFTQTVKETIATEEGTRTAESSVTTPAGDAPDVEPSRFFSIEDWKPWAKRWASRIWTAISTITLPGGGMLSFAAFQDSANWHIYAIVGGVLLVLIIGVGIFATLVVAGIWLWQNRGIPAMKQKQMEIAADPDLKNVGLTFVKK